jgi:hypothetical protein
MPEQQLSEIYITGFTCGLVGIFAAVIYLKTMK